ncbi:TPA: hypothetical protein N0F65_010580 [Lagenidium giganteum]|uniref:Uncharacterized protein n=1 Tax=Lagenidium giganteum TaxID=4803 RepID=A0AAV2ZFG1_9STRA|nr:TPA: hypothetical protein N0F65_010580 [Lagenidium giganteum]
MLGVLGRGTFGLVKLARHKDTGRSVAIKILTKDVIVEMKQEKNILREQTVHLLLQHPFVSKLYSTFQDSQALYFVLEYCPGGELYSLVYEEEEDALRSEFGGLHERHVAFYLACLVLGLDYLHGMNILYRDLKLENLVLDEDGYPKLIDFGLSKPDAANNDQNTTMCGSMEYMAPEVLQRLPYGQKADMWSFGIIMYELLFGTTPFYHTNRREQGRRITMEPVPFPNNFEEEFPEATDLINKLLSKNPLERPTSFEQVRESAFFIKYFPTSSAWKQLENKKYPFGAPFVPHLDGAFDMSLFRAVDDEDDDAFEGY